MAVKIELRCETIHTELACLDSLRGHPAFLQVEDSHVDWQGLSWMIMPMLKTSLRQLLPVAPDAQMAVCVQSLSGLSYMHDKSLLHCDVKPSNIMFCEHTLAKSILLILVLLCRYQLESVVHVILQITERLSSGWTTPRCKGSDYGRLATPGPWE